MEYPWNIIELVKNFDPIVQLNRIRTTYGRCNTCLYKWKVTDSPECDCGASEKTIPYIVLFCPLRYFDGDYMEICPFKSTKSNDWLLILDIQL